MGLLYSRRLLEDQGVCVGFSEDHTHSQSCCHLRYCDLFQTCILHTHTTHHTHTHRHRHSHSHSHTHTHTHTHTHHHMWVSMFYGGLSIDVMVFILYKLYILSPYTAPIPKPTHHRRHSAILHFNPKHHFLV